MPRDECVFGNNMRLIPLLELSAIGRLHLDSLLADILPVGAQNRPARFREGFVHGAACFLGGVLVNLLEQVVQCIALKIRKTLLTPFKFLVK